MDTTLLDSLDKDMLIKCRSVSAAQSHRIIEGDQEIVKYFSAQSTKIWYNDQTDSFPLHWHYAVEIIMPLENTYLVKTKKEEVTLSPGDILIIPAGELHELITPETGSRMIGLFDYAAISNLNGFSSLTPFLSQLTCIRNDPDSPVYVRVFNLLNQIFYEYTTQNSFYELVIYSRLISFFVAVGRYKMLGDKDYSLGDTNRQKELSQKLAIAFDYIDTHYTEEVTLEDVAFVAGFSKFHFSRLFKQCSGQNFHEYLCFKRVKASEVLLLKPELSVTEIAFQAGFASLSTFNRTFKTINHCSPTEYRALCTGK